MMPFFYIHILQGSVATCLKRGGIFKHEFVANLLPSRLVKNFENRIIVKLWPRVGCLVFLTHGVDNASVVHLSASNAVLCCRVLRRNGLGIMFTDCSSVCAFVRASPERRRSPTGLPSKYSSSFSR